MASFLLNEAVFVLDICLSSLNPHIHKRQQQSSVTVPVFGPVGRGSGLSPGVTVWWVLMVLGGAAM